MYNFRKVYFNYCEINIEDIKIKHNKNLLYHSSLAFEKVYLSQIIPKVQMLFYEKLTLDVLFVQVLFTSIIPISLI